MTVNTDNRLMSDTTMTNELALLDEHLEFNLEDVKKLLMNGFKSAFLRYPERKALIAEANEALEGMS